MGARTGDQFLDGLRSRTRDVWIDGERIDDVTSHPLTRGAARTLAGVFDRQFEYPDECLIADPETGEKINVSHMQPRSIEDLRARVRGLSRISEYTVGLMGRTPDYMNVKFASFKARYTDWEGADGCNREGAENLLAFTNRLARQDISLTHTIIQPNIDKRTDSQIIGNKVTIHKVGETKDAIVIRGARILATLAPFADEIAVYPALPIPQGAEDYALAFSIPMDTPGLKFLCRDSASSTANLFDKPLSSRFDEQDAFVVFDDVELPKERVFLGGGPGSVDIYNSVTRTGLIDNMSTQTTIRALNKLEFAYGLGTRMAEMIGDHSQTTYEMLGELLSYVEVTRNAIFTSTEQGYDIGNGVFFPGGRALTPMRSLLATWFPRVNEILILIGSHNLLATPSRRQLDHKDVRPLVDEFIHGADGADAESRAALFRLAWDFVGSTLGGRNVLYERFYLTSAARNRFMAHVANVDRSRPYELVESILAAGKAASGAGAGSGPGPGSGAVAGPA
jgi:4-hydroxyphenylacetate 3-monooxygenase oxygenase component